jgi:hypothetical protein
VSSDVPPSLGATSTCSRKSGTYVPLFGTRAMERTVNMRSDTPACGVRSATAVIPVAPLEGRLSIAHRRQVIRGYDLDSSTVGSYPLYTVRQDKGFSGLEPRMRSAHFSPYGSPRTPTTDKTRCRLARCTRMHYAGRQLRHIYRRRPTDIAWRPAMPWVGEVRRGGRRTHR